MQLARMGAAAVARVLQGRPVVLLPLGSFESHGPGTPMGDYLLGEALAVRIAHAAAAAGQGCVVAPALPFGGADWFGSVPGAIALGQGTLRAVIDDMLGCLLRHGCDRLVILNGHGGNSQAVHAATLAVRARTGVMVPSLYLWRMARVLMDGLPGGADGRAGHGGDPVASIALHLLGGGTEPAAPRPPATVHGLPVVDFGTGLFEGLPVDLPLELDEIAPDGVAPGVDPRRASAEDGAWLAERLVAACARFVVHHAQQDAG